VQLLSGYFTRIHLRCRWAGHVARMGRGQVCTGFWWGSLREGHHWGDRRKLEDNIKMDLQEVGGGCGNWMVRAQDRDSWRARVSTVMNFRVP
jgi:hypothetical protein